MKTPRLPRLLLRIGHWSFVIGHSAALCAAATYYVDHAAGNNAADGLAPATAWRHAPGDAAATGNPASAALQPGDTVRFKGGVPYHGALTIARSGSPGNPITYDGNADGSYGDGPAILDGSHTITGWQPVTSSAAVKGNPDWNQLFYADIDVDVTSNTTHNLVVMHRLQPVERQAPWQRVMLCDGDQGILPIARHPKPADPFYPDLPADFHLTPNRLDVVGQDATGVIHLTDPARFTSPDPAAYNGVMVGFHAGNNHVYFADIKAYAPSAHRITFPHFATTATNYATSPTATYTTTRYALYNSPAYIEQPGEWSITPLGNGRSRIHLLPLQDGLPAHVSYPVHGTAITVPGGTAHLRIQGFSIRRYSGGRGGIDIARDTTKPRSRDITITGNEIRLVSGHAGIGVNYANDIVVSENTIRHCPGWTTGIFLDRATGFTVSGNHLDKNSGSGIRLYEGLNGLITGNTILEHYGIHSSAVNLYEGCTDIIVEKNFIENTVAINRNAERLTLRHNVIDSKNRNPRPLTFWFTGTTRGNTVRDIEILNNTIINNSFSDSDSCGLFAQASSSQTPPPEGLVVRGNIMDRPVGVMHGVFENNIYLRQPGSGFMGPGCIVVADPAALFIDPANGDYRRLPGGPLPASGADLAEAAGIPAAY